MVELKKYKEEFFNALNSYNLDKNQWNFTASLDFCLNERKDLEDLHKTLVTILFNDYPVGFFVLDKGEDKYKLTENSEAILLRSLSINPEYQGKGIGKQSMRLVKEFIKENIPQINEIFLSVNLKNKNAYYTYIKAGYVDENKIVFGLKGPLNVLIMIIS